MPKEKAGVQGAVEMAQTIAVFSMTAGGSGFSSLQPHGAAHNQLPLTLFWSPWADACT